MYQITWCYTDTYKIIQCNDTYGVTYLCTKLYNVKIRTKLDNVNMPMYQITKYYTAMYNI
jgi:hypothetical protein